MQPSDYGKPAVSRFTSTSITYCHFGQTPSLDDVAVRSLGYNVHLYDGSFEDWSGREDLPLELPAKQDSTKN